MKFSKLRQARMMLMITQKELAKRIEMTREAISAYENGRSRPNKLTRCALSDILGIDERYLWPDKIKNRRAVK